MLTVTCMGSGRRRSFRKSFDKILERGDCDLIAVSLKHFEKQYNKKCLQQKNRNAIVNILSIKHIKENHISESI